jgi:hypothetical protein
MATGRPPKLTKEIINKIGFLVELGVTPPKAAEYCGCSRSSYYSWMKQARESSRKNNCTRLLDKIVDSQSKLEQDCLKDIKASKDWRAKQWLLEHLDKIRYGAVQKVEVEHSGKTEVEVSIHDKITDYDKYFHDLDTS